VRRLGWFLAGAGVAAAVAARFFTRPAPVPVVREETPAPPVTADEAPAASVTSEEAPAPEARRTREETSEPPVVSEEAPESRASELRQRIAEARELLDEREEFEQAETPVDRADPDARRRSVHERGREAAERMRRDQT
jgi:hypothetical protein